MFGLLLDKTSAYVRLLQVNQLKPDSSSTTIKNLTMIAKNANESFSSRISKGFTSRIFLPLDTLYIPKNSSRVLQQKFATEDVVEVFHILSDDNIPEETQNVID